MTWELDVKKQVAEICAMFGVEPTNVLSITIHPTTVEVLAYATNAKGEKIYDDGSGGVTMKRYNKTATTA